MCGVTKEASYCRIAVICDQILDEYAAKFPSSEWAAAKEKWVLVNGIADFWLMQLLRNSHCGNS